jgi:VWFA-related protein
LPVHPFLAFACAVLLVHPASVFAQSNKLKIQFHSISIDSSTVLDDKTASFPDQVISVLTVKDPISRYMHGLADTSRWLSASDTTQRGELVSDVWQILREYHVADTTRPPNPDVKTTSPGFQVRELKLNMGLSVAMVMDVSGSMIGRFDSVETAAKVFVRQMSSKDRLAVYKFARESFLMQDFTNDTTKLIPAIEKDSSDYGGTYVYDAIWKAIDATKTQPERRIIIVYTDGRDHLKGKTIEQVIAYAQKDSIPVYTIGLSNNNPLGGGPQVDNLRRIAEETGALFFFAPSIDSLASIYTAIYGHISGYYVLAHASPDPFTNGKKRALDVTLRHVERMGASTLTYTGRDTMHYRVPFIPPNLSLSLAASKPTVMAGDTVSFRIGLANTGRGHAAETHMTFRLGDSLSFAQGSIEPVPDSVRTNTAFWSYYRIRPSGSEILRFAAKLRAKMPMGDTALLNRADVTCLDDSVAGDNSVQAVVQGMGRPELTLRVHPVGRVLSPGVPDTLRATVLNSGNADASMPFETGLFQGTSDTAAAAVTLAFLAAGDSEEVEVPLHYPRIGLYPVRITADIGGRIPEQREDDNSDTTTVTVGIEHLGVQISDVSLKDLVRDEQASFPNAVMLTVNVLDQNGHMVHGLADTASWIGPEAVCQAGLSVGSVWESLFETNLGATTYRPNPDVKPTLRVTEINRAGLSLALAVDGSTDLGASDALIRSRLKAFVRTWSGQDAGSVFRFNGSVEQVVALTSDRSALENGLNASGSGAGRLLYDAVAGGIASVSGRTGRNAVMAVAGGEDQGSVRTLEQVVETAREAAVPVFLVFFGGTAPPISLRTLAEQTGGALRQADSDSTLVKAIDFMNESLRDFYAVRYASPDTTEDRTWREVRIGLNAFIHTDTDTALYRAPLGRANLAVRLTGRTGTFTAAAGDTAWSVHTDSTVQYAVQVRNIGHQNLAGIRFTGFLPGNFTPVSVPSASAQVRGDTLSWTLAELPVRGIERFTFVCRAETLLVGSAVTRTASLLAECAQDTILRDNSSSFTVTYIPLMPPDLAVDVAGRGDTLRTVSGRPFWFTAAGGTVTYTVTVSNIGELSCRGIAVNQVLPREVSPTRFDGASVARKGDTLIWSIGYLASRTGTHTLTCTGKVTEDLPSWQTELVSVASAQADPSASVAEVNFSNNADMDTMFVKELIPPNPEVRLDPASVEPGDSIRVALRSHVEASTWDLVVVYENGERIEDYGDAFLQTVQLDSGQWIQVLPSFADTRMRTDNSQETVRIIFRTTDKWGATWADTASFVIRSSDDAVLGQNLFRPAEGVPLAIQFKLSSNRKVDLAVYDASGAFVRRVADERFNAGWNSASWDGKDENGHIAGSGLYVALIRSGELKRALKFILVR